MNTIQRNSSIKNVESQHMLWAIYGSVFDQPGTINLYGPEFGQPGAIKSKLG